MNDSALPSGVAYTRDNAVDVVAPPAPPPPAPPPSTSPPPPPPPPPVAPFDAPSATVDLGTPRGEPCVDGEDHLPSGIRMIIIGLLVGFFLVCRFETAATFSDGSCKWRNWCTQFAPSNRLLFLPFCVHFDTRMYLVSFSSAAGAAARGFRRCRIQDTSEISLCSGGH